MVVAVAVSVGTEVEEFVIVAVVVGVSEGSEVAEGDGDDVEMGEVALGFSANWVAVWSTGGRIELVVFPSTGDADTMEETGVACGLDGNGTVASMTRDPSVSGDANGEPATWAVPVDDGGLTA